MIPIKIIDDFFFHFVNTLLLDRQLKYTITLWMSLKHDICLNKLLYSIPFPSILQYSI